MRDIVFLIEREVMGFLQDGLDRSFGYRIGSITKVGDLRRRICVEGTTLDSYCEPHNIRPAGFKINVEGAERTVTKGEGENTIANCSSWVLLESYGKFMSANDRETNWKAITDSR